MWPRDSEARYPERFVLELISAIAAEAVAGRNAEDELRRRVSRREVQAGGHTERMRECETDIVAGKIRLQRGLQTARCRQGLFARAVAQRPDAVGWILPRGADRID